MSDANERLLRAQGFRFFGAISASLSHDINNVLATINELSGLLDDSFCAAETGAPLNAEKLKGTTKRIAAQVQRGRGYVTQLNGFAHTVDNESASVMLNETVDAVTTLCRRFGSLRRVELEASLSGASPRIEGSAFDVQHIVFRCIDIVLNASEQGDVVQIGVESENDGARLVFAGGSAVESAVELEAKRDVLAVLVAEAQGTMESVVQVGCPVRLEVSLPCKAPAKVSLK
jgi:C4-dicarboxylate-specific signal transduction histidine kinase